MITDQIGPGVLRTALKAAAGAVAAAMAMTACGSQLTMGAAATFDKSRISEATLDATVVRWQRDMRAHPDVALERTDLQNRARQQVDQGMITWEQARLGLPFDPDSPARTALAGLIGFRVWDEVARQQGITIKPLQIDGFIRTNGGQRSIANQTLLLGMPVSYSRDEVRAYITRVTLLAGWGATPDQQGRLDPAVVQRLQALVGRAAEALRIKVSPRFGSFNPVQAGLALPTFRMSKPDPALNGAPQT